MFIYFNLHFSASILLKLQRDTFLLIEHVLGSSYTLYLYLIQGLYFWGYVS